MIHRNRFLYSRPKTSALEGVPFCMISKLIPVVPHKAVAEVSKIGNLQEKLVVVNQGWRSEAAD